MLPSFATATDLLLDLDPTAQERWFRANQTLGTPASRWRGYLNEMALETVLPWLRAIQPEPVRPGFGSPGWSAVALRSLWEGCTGTPLQVGSRRWLLLPGEEIDGDELRIPQEWVDLPGYQVEVVLLVQIDPDEHWLRILGYATHAQIKATDYDPRDRSYSLTADAYGPDLTPLWLSPTLQPYAPLPRPTALPSLNPREAEALIERLAAPHLLNPRLEVPWERWAALWCEGEWRQRWAARRWTGSEAQGSNPWGVLSRLGSPIAWLQEGVSAIAQGSGWELMPSVAGVRSVGPRPGMQSGVQRSLRIAGQDYLLQLQPVEATPQTWRFCLRPVIPGELIPPGTLLRLLTEDFQAFEGNEDRAETPVHELFIDVTLEPGEGVIWGIEPEPEDYTPEILGF